MILLAMSFKNTRNNVGPSTVPWGTPDVTLERREDSSSIRLQFVAVGRGGRRSPTIVYYSKCRSRKASPPAVGVAHYQNGVKLCGCTIE